MRIIAADDEQLQLEKLVEAIEDATEDAEIHSFGKAREVIRYVQQAESDVAFLDIEMPGMTGIELAKQLRELNPKMNIIFVTSYDQYKGEAMDLRASGYIMKPVTPEKIKHELEELRYPLIPDETKVLRVQCFGNFDIFDRNNVPVHFDRSKAKELLAYLVSRDGTRCTTQELITALYETDKPDRKVRDNFQHAVSSMVKALRNVGAEDAIIRNRQNYAINPEVIDCDYYRFKRLDAGAVNAYTGEFMSQYSWAEFITGYLNMMK